MVRFVCGFVSHVKLMKRAEERSRHEEESVLPSGPGIHPPPHWERRAAVAAGGAGEEPLRGFNRDLRLAERRRSSSGDGNAAKTPPAISAMGGVVLDDVDGYTHTHTHKHTQAHTSTHKHTQAHTSTHKHTQDAPTLTQTHMA